MKESNIFHLMQKTASVVAALLGAIATLCIAGKKMPKKCIGEGHSWRLAVCEGNAGVTTTPCGDDCDWPGGTLGDNAEWLEIPETPVTLNWATDCPAYDVDEDSVPIGGPKTTYPYESGSHYVHHGVRCDCNHWPVAKVVRNEA